MNVQSVEDIFAPGKKRRFCNRHLLNPPRWGRRSESTPKIALPPIGSRVAMRERKLLLRAALLGLGIMFGVQLVLAENGDVRRVLVLTEQAAPAVTIASQQIESSLTGTKFPFEVQLYTESLEANLFDDLESMDEQRRLYAYKYRFRKPDLILALGPSPIKLIASNVESFFPGTPVVFCGSTREQAANPVLTSDFTGAWMVARVSQTVETALHLQPGTQHLAIVGGQSSYDRNLEEIVRADLRGLEGKLDIIDLTNLGMSSLLDRVSKLPAHTIVLFTSLTKDAEGRHFANHQSVPMVTRAASAPTYGLADTLVGWGVVGGDVVSFSSQGKIAADDAVKILRGAKPSEIPITEGPTIYMFDWRQLRRWGIAEERLPNGSAVLYREPTLWAKYKWPLIAGALAAALMGLLIAYFWLERARRRRVELELEFQRLISELSAYLIDLPADKIDAGIDFALDRISKSIDVERLNLHEFVDNGTDLLSTHGSGNQLPDKLLLRQDYPYTISRLSKNNELIVANFDLLTEMPTVERELIFSRNVRAGVFLPLEAGGAVLGVLSFVSRTERQWSDSLIEQMRMLAQIFANALVRRRADEALLTSELLKGAILSSLNDNVVVLDHGGTVISTNSWVEPMLLSTSGAPALTFGPGANCVAIYKHAGERGISIAQQIFGGTEAVLKGERSDFELEWERDFGETKRWFTTTVTPLKTNSGGVIVSHTEITNRKEAEEDRLELSGRLIDMQEKERGRLARELHDDFNQRLALLAIDLERVGQTIAKSPVEAREKLHELWARAAEIGADLHSLSHQLHSSTLESLGLVLGVSSLCGEFSEQQGIEVDFTHENVPRSLPSDLALCLFRIAQESLRNIKRHSGATRAEVRLEGEGHQISLTIADKGKGFDVHASAARAGLGIRSMRERLRLVRGRFDIQSRPGEGTIIRVWVPLSPPNQVPLSTTPNHLSQGP